MSSSPHPTAAFTRRDFIRRTGWVGGSGAAWRAMGALGLLAPALAPSARPQEPLTGVGGADAARTSDGGNARPRVVILGAGLAGMAAAYELGKLGYLCELFEARARPGGRCWTVRAGDTETEVGGPAQTAAFAPGQYLNPGPARIPGHHRITLGYCREFGVAVEAFNNLNEAAYYQPKNLPRVRLREAHADLRGYVDELLAKAVQRDALDRPMTAADKEALVEYLRRDAALSPDLFYRPTDDRDSGLINGGNARGYAPDHVPGAGDRPGQVPPPADLETVIKAGFAAHLGFEHQYDQQPTMLQPVGGIDAIARAFAARVEGRIRYRHEVREIRRGEGGQGVRVVVADLAAGGSEGITREVRADYCICTIPLSVLRAIPADFSPPVAAAIRSVPYMETGKIGLQFRRRFWEEDDAIYGGISWSNDNITQILYPNAGYLGRDGGVLIGYYHFGPDAEAVGALSPAERQRHALDQGARIHPQYPQEFLGGFSVAWHRLPYNLGGWARWDRDTRATVYPVLNQADGPFYLAGEHLTYQGGWMAGALESAVDVVARLHERVRTVRPA